MGSKEETFGSRYINSFSHPAIGIVGFCKNTDKSAGGVKKRQDFHWFPLPTCCSAPLYDQLWYLELCDVYNNNNVNDNGNDNSNNTNDNNASNILGSLGGTS